MRANEFMEGPGDWMQKQVIGRQQKDKAKAQKQNAPKIAKLIQQNFAAKAKSIGNDPAALKKMIDDTLSKALKVQVNSKAELFGDSLDNLVNTITQNPSNIGSDEVHGLIQDVVMKSFAADSEADMIDPELVKALKEKTKDLEPAAARKVIMDFAKSKGKSELEANRLADAVIGDEIDIPDQNVGALTQFVADVFYIEGRYDAKKDGKQKAYVNREGKWSLWRLAKRNLWEFSTSVADDTEDKAIETLIRKEHAQPIPMTFTRKDDNYYKVE